MMNAILLPDTIVRNAHDSDTYYAEYFGRRIVNALLRNDLTPERAAGLGRLAGSYGRRALDQQATITHRILTTGQFGRRR